MTEHTPTRRTVLGTAAGTLTALAGCTSSTQPGSSGDPFQDVAVNEATVVVSLAPENQAERVNLIDPKGERVGSSKVVSGETRLEFDLGMTYTPGEFDVVAEPTGETSIEIQPDVEIQEVGVGANHLDRIPDALGSMKEEEALVVVENKGNGPVSIRDLIFSGDVPNPTDSIRDSENRSGIFDTQDEKGEASDITLFGGDQETLFSTTIPFSFEGSGRDCEPTPYSAEFTTSLATSIDGKSVESEFKIRYSGAQEYDGCSVTVEGPIK
ncbi:hypothetical protein [Halorarius litoreus]|uniref:hypothetical protein n=1 Tax=Halorarius litoreus TaxID=2962676 RepID=UPI0020CC7A1A|nr:hypothetical protein [Halorarius litoreus]